MCIRRGLAAIPVAAACLFALASAQAAFGPLDPELRISHMGPDGSTSYLAIGPKLAYNSTADEYLAVWEGTDNAPGLHLNEREIYAQRLSESGAPLGARVRVSHQGPDGDFNWPALAPEVAYNPASNEYLVVWYGGAGTSGESEVWGQRVSASGVEVGTDDFRISNVGPSTNDTDYDAVQPAVAANPSTGEYLVVWYGDDLVPPLVNDELEIFGQRLTAAGVEIGVDDFRISEQGADGVTTTSARVPSVAYNPSSGEFLVVWNGEDGVTDKIEIWAQRLSAAGAEVGGSDYQISAIGPTNDANYNAFGTPVLAANPVTGGYLAAFAANAGPPLATGEYEIWGQQLTAQGQRTNVDDFRISEIGPDGNSAYSAQEPAVAADPLSGEYLVFWRGDDALVDKFEIWGQRLNGATHADIGGDFQLTHTGPDGDETRDAFGPAVAVDPTPGDFFVAYEADADVQNENEIYARRLGVPAPVLVGTTPAGPANDNNPKVKASIPSVDPSSTIDLFANASCSGAPAVNDAPAGDLIGSGIAATVADNSTTSFAVTSSIGGHTSRCSNAVTYVEQTPPGPPPPPPPPVVDRTAPVVTGFVVAPAKVRPKQASSFRFKLSEQATVVIVIERVLPGRKVGKRCVAPTAKNERHARCRRFKRTAALTFKNRPAGANKLAFKRKLAAGAYRATNTATDAAKNPSKPKRASFKALRR
jgi:hypothetical protein